MRGKVSFVYLGFNKGLAKEWERRLTTLKSKPILKSKPRRTK